MKPNLRAYVVAVTLAGFVSAALAFSAAKTFGEIDRLLAYLALACLASTWKVKLPGMRGTISVNFLFILIGVADLPRADTLLIGGVATLVQCYWRPRRRPGPTQVAFNVAAILLSIAIGQGVTLAVTDRPNLPVFLVLTASLYFVANSGLVSLAVSLSEAKPFQQVWRNCYLWTFPYYLTGAGVAAIISAATRTVGWRPALFPLTLMYLVFTYYRNLVQARTQIAG